MQARDEILKNALLGTARSARSLGPELVEIAASLDLDTTVRAILDHVGRLVPSDVLELKLWSEERNTLLPFRNKQTNASRVVTAALSRFGGLTDQLSAKREPVIINDVRALQGGVGELLPIQSYLGIPLIAGGKLVGTLEAGQLNNGAFGQHDLSILHLISGQAAVAIRNAKLYEDEQKRGSSLVTSRLASKKARMVPMSSQYPWKT